jgi:hypothetical protein
VRRLTRIELPGNKKRASDSFESLDARAALPQNCSPRNVSRSPTFGNGPYGLELPTNVPSLIATSANQLTEENEAEKGLAIQRFFFVLFHEGKSEAESNWDLACTGFDRLIRNTMA